MTRLLPFALASLLASCSSLPTDNRSPEQIKADGRSVQAVCSTASGLGYTGRVVQVSVDSAVIQDGSIAVTQDCQISFINVRTKPKDPQ
jgi:hypothetical protein